MDDLIQRLRAEPTASQFLRTGDSVESLVAERKEAADRIAALEAEKADRERQEPVAWAWNDALGCMHAHCGSGRPVWVDGECSDAKRAETSLRPLYAAPPIPRIEQEPVAWDGVSDLSQESPLWREWAESRHSVQQIREELERLRAENARLIGDHTTALRLVADVRAAIGDDGKRMQPELIEYCKAMKRDAERYRTVRAWHNNDVDVAVVRAKEPIYGARLDEIVDKEMGGGNDVGENALAKAGAV